MLSRLENEVLGREAGLKALDGALRRSTDALLRKQGKRRLIIDVDSTEDPAHGDQESAAYNGHFGTNCFHPLFAFTSEGACLGAKLRPGNVHSADGALAFLQPIVKRYRPWFGLFWLRGDAAFANPDIYEYCENKRLTYCIRLPENQNLRRLVGPHLARPVGRPPRIGSQVKVVDFPYQAKSWTKPRRVICRLEWPQGEMFAKINFIVTNSRLPRAKIVKVYNGRGDVENRIKEGKNTLRWHKTSCHRFGANHARLKMGALAYTCSTCSGGSTSRERRSGGPSSGSSSGSSRQVPGSPVTPGDGTFTWPRPSRWRTTPRGFRLWVTRRSGTDQGYGTRERKEDCAQK